MDKMPKFRRKPKPPAIETAIDRSAIAADAIAEAVTVHEPVIPTQPSAMPQKSSKIAAIKSLRLRHPSKRARDSPPAELPSGLLPPAVVTKDGLQSPRKVQVAISPSGQDSHQNGHKLSPQLPVFLSLSQQDIDFKYQELTWTERNRVAQGMRSESGEENPWSLYRQPDWVENMDRYMNIKPWAHNRVKLQVPENEFDYVNASTVTLTSPMSKKLPPLRYIAMQGPTKPSFSSVWRMIAEQTSSPAVIVQLTNMIEANALKCDQYFPVDKEHGEWDLNEDNVWGDDWNAKLSFDSLEQAAGGAIEKRKLLLKVEGEAKPRVIWHLLYRCWPDFGVPALEDLDSFFELMNLSRQYSAPGSARIIHCSAGVGRTGTFICLEHLIRELESGALARYDFPKEKPDLIYDTVDILRQQRRAMVQGEIQYRFIYQVMHKLWQDKYGVASSDEDSVRGPAPKRLEVADPFVDNSGNSGIDIEGAGSGAS